MRPPFALGASVLTVLGTTALLPLLAPTAAHAATPHLVVSEVYGGGGNSGSTYTNDFVELSNPTGADVSVAGWSVQYASATGTSYQVTPLSGTVPAGRSYLVQEAQGAGGTTALPAPDVTGTIAMSATAGKVALVSTATALSCGAACHAATGVVDFVGYGTTANDVEGSGPAPAPSATTSDQRTAGDTDDNAKDFATAAPTPTGSTGTSGGGGSSGPVAGLRIHDVQGAALLSPYAGKAVTGVPGVVTAVGTNQFWFQDPSPDASDATSEALDVFTSTKPTVAVGDAVTVSGNVQEYRPATTAAQLSVTELTGPTVTVVSSGNPLPAAVVVGAGGRTPPTETYDSRNDTTGNLETSGTFDPTYSGVDFWESLEGMRVELDHAAVVGPTNSYGETAVVTDGATGRTTRGGISVTPDDFNPERVVVSSALTAVPTADVGDTFSSPVVGVLTYAFGEYQLDATQTPTVVRNHLAPTVAPAATGTELSLATFNVENLSPADPQSKFDRLAGIVVANLGSPDVVAVEEIQDDDGPTDDGVVDASKTWQQLIAAIAAAGGPTYSYTQIDPVNDKDGGQPGGNIRQGFLYRTDRGLTFVSRPGGTSTTAESVTADGQLTYSPGRVDPSNAAWSSSRKPLAAQFSYQGKPLILVANHWVSKGGDDDLFGFHQPPQQPSETQRTAQAQAVHDLVRQVQAASPDAEIGVLGDLNDMEFSQSVQTLTAGTGLVDLPATLPRAERYTYDYEGNSEVLDHILLSASLDTGAAYQVVHVNSEYADQASDHDPQVVTLFTPATPPPSLPEARYAAGLPVVGLALIGGAVVWGRRRRGMRGAPGGL